MLSEGGDKFLARARITMGAQQVPEWESYIIPSPK